MRESIRTALLFLCLLMFGGPALASGDVGCYPTLKLFQSGFSSCDGMGFLGPSNDTRINLIYLMADAHNQKLVILHHDAKRYPIPNDFIPGDWQNFTEAITPEAPAATDGSAMTSGEGTICVSDIAGGTNFIAAITAAADLSDEEKRALSEARKALHCGAPLTYAEQPPMPQLQSASAKDFFAYLSAVNHFYKFSHTDSSAFVSLANSTQPWVKEAAVYMQARVMLLAAQANAFDDYGTMQKDKIDPVVVRIALDALNAYLKDYPDGAYAASATNLLRRAYWLGGDTSKLNDAYAKVVSSNEVNATSLAVVNEMDYKLPADAFADGTSNPMLLAVQDFRLMREHLSSDGKPEPGMKAEVLEAQRQRFADQPALFEYLLAARAWFVDKDAKAVLAVLQEKPIPAELTYLEFSRQILRGAALDATNSEAARPALVALFPAAKSAYQRQSLELALAMSDERHKKIGPDFDADTLIKDPTIRKQLLDYVAGPIILRQTATAADSPQEEREIALYRLFSRDLVQGHFKNFLDDIKLLPPKPAATTDASQEVPTDRFEGFRWEGRKEGYICPDVASIAKILNANPRDIHGRMCLGDLFRLKGVTDISMSDKDVLGGTGTLFAGKHILRSEIYADIMKDKSAPRDDRAYALFRAVHCYEPAHSNDCGGNEVPESTRKGWYDELKGSFGDTAWAKALRYYW